MAGKPRLTGKRVGIYLGIFLVLTFFIPWEVPFMGSPLWSWDAMVLFELMPEAQQVQLAGPATVGLLLFVLAIALRGLPLAIVYLVLGAGACATFFGTGEMPIPFEFVPRTITALSPETWRVLGLVIAGGFLIVTGVRSRLGVGGILCIPQLAFATLFSCLFGLLMFEAISDVDQMPMMDQLGKVSLLVAIVGYGLLALSGLLSIAHGLAVKSTTRYLSRIAVRLTWVALVCLAVYFWVAAPTVELQLGGLENPREIVEFLSQTLRLLIPALCAIGLLMEGIIALKCEIGYRVFKPAIPMELVASGGNLERLRELDGMRKEGLVSDDEYAARRARILDEP
ncbi:MAG: SHOCT domain-containing protein [Planctomycetota bacterium]|jgi:hypothetical protein